MKKNTAFEKKTSWEKISSSYDQSVGKEGHYYHEHVVLPGILKLLKLEKTQSVAFLDLACGQGVLERALPKDIAYTGIDISPSLIKFAKASALCKTHNFYVGDASKPLPIQKKDFTHGAIVLALQNIRDGAATIHQAGNHLAAGATFIIVLNHPCYRIPRQSSWGVESEKKIQYRRVDLYMSPLEIPIMANPGKGEKSETTWSFHHPLSTYTKWLSDAGFTIDLIEEWCSDKTSTGGASKMENRARKEFPLFLAIKAIKRTSIS